MIWEVKLYVGGKVFVESVHAVNRNDAIDTAKSRNPKAKVIGVNPTLREVLWIQLSISRLYLFVINLSQIVLGQERMSN